MKIVIFVLALLLTAFQANGQVFGKKKSKNADPRDAQIDSLTMLTKTLTLQLDSVSGELSKYAVPADSLRVPVDTSSVIVASAPLTASTVTAPATTQGTTTAAVIAPVPAPLIAEPKGPAAPDSVAILLQENKKLSVTADSLQAAMEKTVAMLTSEEVVKATAVGDLKKLKELLDAGIITAAEFTVLKKKYLEKL